MVSYPNRKRVRVAITITALLLVVTLFMSSAPGIAAGNPLQIGWFTGAGVHDLTRIDTQQANGETLQVAYYVADPSAYLAKLNQVGMKTFLQLDGAAAKAGDTAALVSYVNTYKSNPAIAAWYLYDEPEFNSVNGANLVKDYLAIKAADPTRPVAIAFGNSYCSYVASSSDPNYFNAADIILFDQYPVHDQAEFAPTAGNRYSMEDVSTMVNDCLQYLGSIGGAKKFYPVVQGFNWGGIGPGGKPERDPTYGEVRYFTFMPLIRTVNGLFYWVDYRASPPLTDIVHRAMKEASALGTVLQTGLYKDPSVQVNNPAILYKYGSDGTNKFLIAVNNSANTVNAQFTLPSSSPSATVTTLYDDYSDTAQAYKSRSLKASSNVPNQLAFSDTFTKYQVHIYQIVNGAMVTPTPIPQADSIGAYKSGQWYLRNSNTPGAADIQVTFGGASSDLPVVGDWEGNGIDTIGIMRGSTGGWSLSNSNTFPSVAYSFVFGNPGDSPLSGRWDSTMNHDGPGVYRNSNGILYLKRQLSTGFSDYFMIYGNPGDTGIAGDWDGNGYDSVGIYRPSAATWYLTYNNGNGVVFSNTSYPWTVGSNSYAFVGDWTGNKISSAAYLTSTGTFTLHLGNTAGAANTVFAFGPTGARPIAGKWLYGPALVAPPPPSGVQNVIVTPPPTGTPIPNDTSGGLD